MALLERVNQFLLLFIDTLCQVGRWRIWILLLPYFLLQWFVLYVLYSYPEGLFNDTAFAWVSLFGREKAVAFGHYPQHLLLLGEVSHWAKLLVGLVLEGLVLGFVADRFLRGFVRREIPREQRSFLSRWMNLTAVWIVINGLMLAAGQILPGVFAPWLDGPRRIMAFSFVFMPSVFISIFSLLFLALPSIVLFQDGALKAIVRSLKHFFRRPFTFFGLGLVIFSVPLLLGAFAGNPAGIVDSFKPELVYWILVSSLVVEMVSAFLWMGTSVRYLCSGEH